MSVPIAVRIRAPSGLNAPYMTLESGIGQGGDELARGRIPELGGCIRACRQDPSTIRTKGRVR